MNVENERELERYCHLEEERLVLKKKMNDTLQENNFLRMQEERSNQLLKLSELKVEELVGKLDRV